MIIELTRLRKSHPAVASIKSCSIFSGSILVYYENGHKGLFSLGDLNPASAKQEVPTPVKTEDELQHTGSERERDVYAELSKIWQSVNLPDDLTGVQLTHADMLVQKMFATTSPYQIEFATYNMLGLKGNRYLEIIKRLPDLSLRAYATFYEGYLDNQALYMRQEDMPTDAEKRAAIQNLLRVFTAQPSDDAYLFSPILSKEIQRLDPAAYEIILQRGGVSDRVSP